VGLGSEKRAVLSKLHLDGSHGLRVCIRILLTLPGWFPQERDATSMVNFEPWKTQFSLCPLNLHDAVDDGCLVRPLSSKGPGSGLVAALLMLVLSELCFQAPSLVGYLFLAHPKVPGILSSSPRLFCSLCEPCRLGVGAEFHVNVVVLAVASGFSVTDVLHSLLIALVYLPGAAGEFLQQLLVKLLLSGYSLLQTLVLVLGFFSALLRCSCLRGWPFEIFVLGKIGEATLGLGICVDELQALQLMLQLAQRCMA